MYHLRKLKCMLLLMFAVVTANAQLDDGKVYNFVNVGKGTSMNCNSSEGVNVTTTNLTSYSQLWYAQTNGDGFTLRNLANGDYLYSPNATSNGWTVQDEVSASNSVFSVTQVSSGYALRVTGNTGTHNYAHADGSNNVVCWESSNQNSQWAINVVDLSEADLNANWDRLNEMATAEANQSVWQGYLNTLFADKACTTLNSTYASMDEATLQTQDAYANLPKTLQEMVLKVHSGDEAWQEANYDGNKPAWDAVYAKKYRVQLYEPYNDPDAASKALRFNAHTNLNNPTGIFANMQEVLYVMVEGEIKDGATLYLASYVGHNQLNGYNDGVELHEGLNIIPSYIDGNNYCINYVVHTFDASKGTGNNAKARKLSDYGDLKIHIEGGYINGYYNKVGDDLYGSGDKNADWDYLEQRATQTDLTVLGEYMVLQFPLKDEDTGGNKGLGSYFNEQVNVEDVIDSWDNVMMWERFVMGLTDQETLEANDKKSPYSDRPYVFEYTGDDTDDYGSDYSDHYNIHGLAIAENSTYMSGGWKSSNYNCNTMDGIIRDLPTNAGSHWGPAHEIGHQHQGPLNMRGLTEVTNNLFSNIVLWYFGETTSRVNGTDGSLENVLKAYNLENSDFFTNNIWAMTHMYYKLFLYYHVLGHNTKFYPRLYEMLRQDPMVIEYNQKGAESLLHFYKKCCYASGDDLTEFFRAYGFFRVMTDRFVGDYSNAVYNQTQEEIDAAIAEIKAWAKENNAKENISVLFINDATEGTIKSHKGDNLTIYGETTVCSEMGSYATFKEEAANAENYECTMSGNTVTMSGNGGVGLAIFNEKGEIIAFGDNTTFTVSAQCASAIAQGEAVVKVLNADNTVAEVEISDESAVKYSLLGILLDEAEEWLALTDDTGTKVGYYRDGAFTALQEAYNTASGVYSNEESDAYSTAYVVLLQALEDVKNNTYDRIDIVPGYTYRLENEKSSGQYMYVKDDNSVWCQALDESDTKQQWVFEATDEEGMYYLKNASTGNYLGELEKGTTISATAAKSDAKGYVAILVGPGIWALQCQTGDKKSLNYNDGKGVLGWTHDGDKGSHWRITAVSVDEDTEALFSLQSLVKRTKDLAAEMANVQYPGKLALQTVSESEPYYLSTNACYNTLNNTSDGQGLAGLLDADTETFFHSDYGGKVSETHYLQVDLGSETTMSKFAFNYTTRSNGNNCPTEIVVAGSNSVDGTFTTLKTYTAANDGLPNGNALSWESPVIENSGNYRYLRFSVTGTENSKIYFVMSTFGITNHETVVKTIEEKYSTAGLTEQTLRNLGEKLFEANGLMASDAATSELQAMYSSIEESYYAPLLKIYNDANAARLADLKKELSTLRSQTTTLIDVCGTVTVIPGTFNGKAPLQTTAADGDFYVWTNAQSTQETTQEEPNRGYLMNLVDGNNSTYFHSDYSGTNSTDGLHHHITIDLGDNTASTFKFKYITRHDAEANYPKTIKVQGSMDGTNFEDIESVTDLPTGNTKTYESEYMKAGKFYSHLRFMVTANNNNNLKGGHPIFHMAEFELIIDGLPESYTAELKPEAGDAGTELLIETFKQNAEAQGVYDYATTEQQVEDAIAKLQTQYDKLLAAQRSSDKVALRELVALTTALIDECGDLSYVEESTTENVTLKETQTDGFAYLSCPFLYNPNNVTHNNSTDGDVDYNCEQLLDGDITTYIHTNYNAAASTYPHYLQVAFGASAVPEKFKFSYTTRSQGPNQVPKHIIVKGSNDGMDFDNHVLGEFDFEDATNALPTIAGTSWVAAEFLTGGYAYLRFYVTESPQTNPYFAMSEFGLSYTGYAVKWNNAQHGTATNAQLIAAYEARNAANELLATTTTKDALQEAETLLQEKYDELYNAKNSIQYVDFTISSNVAGGGVIYNEGNHTTTLNAPSTLAAGNLTAIALDGYVAKGIKVEGTTITVTYNTVYTVQVVGGNANGGVVYGGNSYLSSASFEAPINLTVADLTAIPLDGYAEPVVTLNGTTITVTYNKTYTVQVIGGGGNGGVTYNEQIYADGATFDAQQSSFTKEDLTAIVPEGYTLKEVTVDHETGVISVSYAAIPLVYTTKYYTLACKATDHETYIRDNGTSINGRSAEGSLFQFEAADEDNGYYIKSYVSEKYLNCTANENTENDAVVESEEKSTVWKMAKHTEGVVTLTAGHDKYLNNNGDAPTYLLARYHNGGPASNNACSLWKLTEGTPLDKSELLALIEETNTLIESCYTDEEFDYAGSLNVTEDLMTATREAVAAAQEKYDSKATTKSEYEAALNALQTAKNNLQTAIAYATLPVQLTYDANTPVTYKIAIDRSASSVLAYDQNSAMVAVSDFKLGNKAHGWYFMPATDGKVYIMPYYDDNTTLALSTNSFDAGNSKVKGMAVGSDGYTQGWTITNVNMSEDNRNAGWYNITCTSNGTDTWYFSNHGGVANKMGFLNDANDGGSRFKFEQITFDKSEAYYTLYNYYMSDTKVASNTITGNDAVGYYPVDAANAYNTAYGTATTVLGDAMATDEDYTNAYDALVVANEALEINMPEEGKYYTIVSACSDHRNGQLMYATSENAIVFSREMTNVKPEALWKFTAEGYLENLQTGCGVSTGSTGGSHHKLGESPRVVSIKSISLDGQVLLTPQGAEPLHAQDNGSVVVGWGAYDASSASAWRIVEVDMANVKFDMEIRQYGHAGLYLNYSVLIPAAVKAYIIDGSDVEIKDGEGSLTLKQIEGSVLPAKTAVILEAEPNIYSFYYTENEANVGTNLLTGSAYQTYCEAETNHNYYIFGHKEGVVGLYKNSVVYDATGAESNTHYKMSANKVLFDWDNSAGNVNAFRFRIEGEETGIEEVTVGAEDTIYDLYGRRLAEVTTSGLYIVNGEKRYVKVK